MRSLVLLALTACSTHSRVTAGPTLGVRHGTTAGGELTGELGIGDEDMMLVVGASGRAGNDLSGVALRTGLELAKPPYPLGGRLSLTVGPMITSADGPGGNEARFEARGAFAVYYGKLRSDDPEKHRKRTMIGVEVFASSIGVGKVNEILLGLGLTFGAHNGVPKFTVQ